MSETCQRMTPSGECGENVVPGTKNCRSHTTSLISDPDKDPQYVFESAELGNRINHFRQHSELHSLKNIIAIAEADLEGLVNMDTRQDGVTQMMTSKAIVDSTKNLANLKKSSIKMSTETKDLYPKDAVMRFLVEVVDEITNQMIAANVPDYEDIVMQICKVLSKKLNASE